MQSCCHSITTTHGAKLCHRHATCQACQAEGSHGPKVHTFFRLAPHLYSAASMHSCGGQRTTIRWLDLLIFFSIRPPGRSTTKDTWASEASARRTKEKGNTDPQGGSNNGSAAAKLEPHPTLDVTTFSTFSTVAVRPLDCQNRSGSAWRRTARHFVVSRHQTIYLMVSRKPLLFPGVEVSTERCQLSQGKVPAEPREDGQHDTLW